MLNMVNAVVGFIQEVIAFYAPAAGKLWWIGVLAVVFALYGLYEAIENKWEERGVK